jgi:acetylornithine deacetylase
MDARAFAHDILLRYRDEIVRVMQDLVRIPSQNMPPVGQEGACQEYIADYLRRHGLTPDVYDLYQAPGLTEHPAFWPGRDYRGRPNVTALLPGKGGGRSLLLTGHCDTVPLGEGAWTKPPFGGEIHDGRLYGLGSLDMKGSLGAMLVLLKAVTEQKIPLRGMLCFESVVDEEFGGVNGTLAGRLRHGSMDAAILGESTDLKIHPAAKGLLISTLTFASNRGSFVEAAVAGRAAQRADVIEQIGIVLTHLDELRAIRRVHAVHPLYAGYPDPFVVEVMKVYAGGWGSQVPITVPAVGRIELVVHMLPGERREDVLQEQEAWLAGVVERNPAAFATRPETSFHVRWLVPTAISPDHPLVQILAASVFTVTGQAPVVTGAPYACDLFALQRDTGMPALVFGPSGGNAHGGDEYLQLDSLFAFWECLLAFVMQWCEVG